MIKICLVFFSCIQPVLINLHFYPFQFLVSSLFFARIKHIFLPQILSDLVQVIYQSGMKGWGVGGGGLKYSIILSVIPEGGEGGAQDHSWTLTFWIRGRIGWVDWQTKLVWARRRNQVRNFLVPKGFRKVEILMISPEACQSTYSISISYLKKESVNKAKKSPNSMGGKSAKIIFSHFSHYLQRERC